MLLVSCKGIPLDKQEALAKVIAMKIEFIVICVMLWTLVTMDIIMSFTIMTQLTQCLTRCS